MFGQVKIQEVIKPIKVLKKSKHDSSQSDQFELQYHQIKKLGLPVNKKKLRIGNWTPEENQIYLKFLEENKEDFVSQQERRKNKVFYRLSKILKKRTPDQCRSHHQKLQMKYEDNVDQIIENIRRKLEKRGPQAYEEQLKKIDISNKKTGVTDTYQVKEQIPVILEQGSFYKLIKKNSNDFALEIQMDHIGVWP